VKRSISRLIGSAVRAEDGELGRVEDFYFDDHKWTIRYMIVNTGQWLQGRHVLISTVALKKPEWNSRVFPVSLTKQQVRNSPTIDTDKPVFRQHEAQLHQYYDWAIYWPTGLERYANARGKSADPHLRSTRHVAGYSVQATDGEMGHVQDFIVDDETWSIRYVVVRIRHWMSEKNTLVFSPWIRSVGSDESAVLVDLSRQSIANAPSFEQSRSVSRAYETRLFEHHGRPKYWENEWTEKPEAAEKELRSLEAPVVGAKK